MYCSSSMRSDSNMLFWICTPGLRSLLPALLTNPLYFFQFCMGAVAKPCRANIGRTKVWNEAFKWPHQMEFGEIQWLVTASAVYPWLLASAIAIRIRMGRISQKRDNPGHIWWTLLPSPVSYTAWSANTAEELLSAYRCRGNLTRGQPGERTSSKLWLACFLCLHWDSPSPVDVAIPAVLQT